MKHAKKLLALALVFAMAFALAVPAFADTGDSPVTFPDGLPDHGDQGNGGAASDEGHTFTAYQIFSGSREDGAGNETPSADNENSLDLYEIAWGSLIEGQAEAFLNDLKADATIGAAFDGINYDKDFPNRSADAAARVISAWGDGSAEAKAFALIVAKYARTGSGTAVEKGDEIAAGYYLIADTTDVASLEDPDAFVRNLSVLFFSGATTFNPQMKVNVPSLEKEVYEVNDSEPAVGNGWGNAADYDIGDAVPFVLTGTLPTGYADFRTYTYTFTDTMSVGLTYTEETAKVYLRNGTDEPVDITTAFTEKVSTNENGETVLVLSCDDLKTCDFKDQITADSYIQVAYTAELNENAVVGQTGNLNEAQLTFTNNPNSDGDGDTGTTPKETVTVFTFRLQATKVQPGDTAGTTKELTGAGFTLYKYDPEIEDYVVVKEIPATEDNAKFTFAGLDGGKYKLVETTVPQGFNKAEDMYFTIQAEYDDEGNLTKLNIGKLMTETEWSMAATDADGKVYVDAAGENVFQFTATEDEGVLTTDILNLKGLQLPSTGGIGTTIFYVVGGLLLVGASVVLITKKRMGSAE